MSLHISRFLKNTNGNFGMMLALAFPAIIAGVALGIDVSNTLATKTEMQDANDAAVLFAARHYKETKQKPTLAQVQSFLDANSNLTMKAKTLDFDPVRTEFGLKSDANVPTMLMGYFNQKNQIYDVLSKANLGFSTDLEFTLSLDTTGSMEDDGRMAGLKVAANDFINTMFDAKDRGADIKGGIVPFAEYVNIGVGHRGQAWLDVPKDIDDRKTENKCLMETPIVGQNNCRVQFIPAQTINHSAGPEDCRKKDGKIRCKPGYAAWTENIPARNETVCDNIYGPEQSVCRDEASGSLTTWQGYVGSRGSPNHVHDGNYNKKIPGLLNVTGSVELQPLTDDRSKLLNKIAELTPDGETYLPEGIIWGARVLSKQAPFTEGATASASGRQLRKVLILMTDGENTLSPVGEYHFDADNGGDPAIADKYTKEACTEAKAQTLEVFTIAFGSAVPNSVKHMLEDCASSPDNYYNAVSSSALKNAFEEIGNDLMNVRLTQ